MLQKYLRRVLFQFSQKEYKLSPARPLLVGQMPFRPFRRFPAFLWHFRHSVPPNNVIEPMKMPSSNGRFLPYPTGNATGIVEWKERRGIE